MYNIVYNAELNISKILQVNLNYSHLQNKKKNQSCDLYNVFGMATILQYINVLIIEDLKFSYYIPNIFLL